jgi:hypothetical protein
MAMSETWRRVSLDLSRIGAIAKAAYILLRLEHGSHAADPHTVS